MYNSRRSEAILPAAECLFNKKKVTPAEIATQFDNSTQIVFKSDTKLKFVNTCEVMTEAAMAKELGQVRFQHHDQRGTSYGAWQIVGFVRVKDGAVLDHYGEDFRTANLPFAVYK